jgi:predicted MFS family arabinose efflux permease
LFSAIFKFLISIANSWQSLVTFVSLERFGKARDAPRDVIITQSTKRNGFGFGFQEAMDRGGAIIGTLLVIFLFWKLQLGMKTIILIAAIVSSLSLIPLIFVYEKKTKSIHKSLFKGINEMNFKLKHFIFVASVFTLGNFGLYAFLLLRAQQISRSVVIPLVIYAVFNLVYALFSTPFGSLSDKIGRKKVILAGYILFFFISLSFIFVDNILLLGFLFSLYGLVYALTQSNQRAMVSDLSGKMKGTSLGLYGSVIGIVNILGGLIAGILWDMSYTTMFIYTTAIALISVLLMMFVIKRDKINHDKKV